MFLSVISSVACSIHNLRIMWKYDDTTQCLLSLFRANTIAVLASLNLINLGMLSIVVPLWIEMFMAPVISFSPTLALLALAKALGGLGLDSPPYCVTYIPVPRSNGCKELKQANVKRTPRGGGKQYDWTGNEGVFEVYVCDRLCCLNDQSQGFLLWRPQNLTHTCSARGRPLTREARYDYLVWGKKWHKLPLPFIRFSLGKNQVMLFFVNTWPIGDTVSLLFPWDKGEQAYIRLTMRHVHINYAMMMLFQPCYDATEEC